MASVSNQLDDDFAACSTVDHAARFERSLAVFFDTRHDQLFWGAASLRNLPQIFENPTNASNTQLSLAVQSNSAMELCSFQFLIRTLGGHDQKSHWRACHRARTRFARRRAMTSAAGLTMPAAAS